MRLARNKLLLVLSGLILSAGQVNFAQAYTCSTTSLSANDGCTQGTFALDTPGNIAIDAPFGIDNWELLDTSNDGIDDAVLNYTIVTTGTTEGIWSLTFSEGSLDPWNAYDDLMITLNGGLGDYVAYSLISGDTTGTYTISGVTDLNHARVWGRVPVPASVWLFGSGLIGLTGLARRKTHS